MPRSPDDQDAAARDLDAEPVADRTTGFGSGCWTAGACAVPLVGCAFPDRPRDPGPAPPFPCDANPASRRQQPPATRGLCTATRARCLQRESRRRGRRRTGRSPGRTLGASSQASQGSCRDLTVTGRPRFPADCDQWCCTSRVIDPVPQRSPREAGGVVVRTGSHPRQRARRVPDSDRPRNPDSGRRGAGRCRSRGCGAAPSPAGQSPRRRGRDPEGDLCDRATPVGFGRGTMGTLNGQRSTPSAVDRDVRRSSWSAGA